MADVLCYGAGQDCASHVHWGQVTKLVTPKTNKKEKQKIQSSFPDLVNK